MADTLPVGSPCPAFHLPATYAKILDLKDYRGKRNLVLIVYPGVNDAEATKYLQGYRNAYKDIKALGTEVIAIGPDSQRLQSIYAYRNNLPFPFLIDEAREHVQMFKALAPDNNTIEVTTYLVDKGGTIRLAEKGFPPVQRIMDALKGMTPPGSSPKPSPG
jgi:peroxiredoxin Q/BCP